MPLDSASGPPQDDLDPVFEEAGQRFGVDPDLLRAQAGVESGGKRYAISPKGALGLMQVMPDTYSQVRRQYPELELSANPFHARSNIMAGAAYLRQMHDQFGPTGAVAAYNAGPGRYQDYLEGNADLPDETAQYVHKVSDAYSATQQRQTPPPKAPDIHALIERSRQAGASDEDIAAQMQRSPYLADTWKKSDAAGIPRSDVFAHFGLKLGTPAQQAPSQPQKPIGQPVQPAGQPQGDQWKPGGSPTTGGRGAEEDDRANGVSAPVEEGPEAPDYTNQYNTKLSPADEAKFQQWLKDRTAATGRDASLDLFDYDLRGAWKANAQAAANGHLPDTWKKPNEPTFSTMSQYHSPATPGGSWQQDKDGAWSFTPSQFNLQMNSAARLQKLWPEQQPGARLNLPSVQTPPQPAVDEFGRPITAQDRVPSTGQSVPAAIGSAAARGAIAGTGEAIGGLGQTYQSGQQREAHEILGLADKIDAGKFYASDVNGMTDSEKYAVAQYMRGSPAQRQAMRTQFMSQLPPSSEALQSIAPGEPAIPEKTNAAIRAGRSLEAYGKGFQVAPENEGIATHTAEMLGGLVPMVAASAAGSLVAGPLGGIMGAASTIWGQTYQQTRDQALQQGIPEVQANDYANKSALGQVATLSAPVGRLIQNVPVPLRGQVLEALTSLAKHGIEFGSFNALATFVQNYVTKNTIDPNQKLLDNVPSAFGEGVIAGVVMPAAGMGARSAVRAGRQLFGGEAPSPAAPSGAMPPGAPPGVPPGPQPGAAGAGPASAPSGPAAPQPPSGAPSPTAAAGTAPRPAPPAPEQALADIAAGKPTTAGTDALNAMAGIKPPEAPPPQAAPPPPAAPAPRPQTPPVQPPPVVPPAPAVAEEPAPFEWATAKVGDSLPDGRGVIIGKGIASKAEAEALSERENGTVWQDGKNWAVVVPEREQVAPGVVVQRPPEDKPEGEKPVAEQAEQSTPKTVNYGDPISVDTAAGRHHKFWQETLARYQRGLVQTQAQLARGETPEMSVQSIQEKIANAESKLAGREEFGDGSVYAGRPAEPATPPPAPETAPAPTPPTPPTAGTEPAAAKPEAAPELPPVGVVLPRDPRVMPKRAGDFMVRTLNGWMVGSEAALRRAVGNLAEAAKPEEVPQTPAAPQSRGDEYRAKVAELDARKAPDSEYRDLLSSGSKTKLPGVKTWRDQVLALARLADRSDGLNSSPLAMESFRRSMEQIGAARHGDETWRIVPASDGSFEVEQVSNNRRIMYRGTDFGASPWRSIEEAREGAIRAAFPRESAEGPPQTPAETPAEPVTLPETSTRPVDGSGNPIFQKGERVVTDDGHHGVVEIAHGMAFQSIFGGQRSETRYHYTVRTDRGRQVLTSKLAEETGEPPVVIPDPVWRGNIFDPQELARSAAIGRQSASKAREAARRARKPENKRELLQAAQSRDRDAAEAQRVLDAWKAKYPEEANRVFAPKAEEPKPPVDTPTAPTAVPSGVRMSIAETTHAKKGIPLFVVKMEGLRVERDVFDKMRAAAKKLDGYWSDYKGTGAIPGWQFKTREAAEAFLKQHSGEAPAEAVKPPEAKPEPKPPAPAEAPAQEWKEVGKNEAGETLYADANGAHSVVRNGVRITEPVGMRPARAPNGGITYVAEIKPVGSKGPEFEVVAPKGESESPPAPSSGRERSPKEIFRAAIESSGNFATSNGKWFIRPDTRGGYGEGFVVKYLAPGPWARPQIFEPPTGEPRWSLERAQNEAVDRAFPDVSTEAPASPKPPEAPAPITQNPAPKSPITPTTQTPPEAAKPPEPKAAPEPLPADFGANNKVFTADAAAAARARLREKFNRLGAGFDPTAMHDAFMLGGFYVEGGIRRFADFAKQMIGDIGDELRPVLHHVYRTVRDYPGFDNAGMDDDATIDAEVKRMAGASPEPETDNGDGRPDLAEPTGDEIRPGGLPSREPEGNRSPNLLEEEPPTDDGTPRPAGGEDGVRPGDDGTRGNGPLPEGGTSPDGRPGAGGEGSAAQEPGKRGLSDRDVRPNFYVDDPSKLIGGTPKQRFARNRAAIEALQAIQAEGREPTEQELQTMAGYTGFGALGQDLFQGTFERVPLRKGWDEESKWLRQYLGKERWEEAQRSIINAHYTDPPTVQAVWNLIRNAGFDGGRVLEPSMGIGNFFGLMPREIMGRSSLTGIELDGTTAAMAKMLYPQAGVHNIDFKDSHTPDNFYDLVVGNWPFSNDIKPADRRYDRLGPNLHDYFFLKALDQTRPGGLVVGITATGTMDKANRSVRLEMAKKGDLIAAFRLPSGAFEKYAGTAVATDLLVFRKRAEPNLNASAEPWVDSHAVGLQGGTVRLNQYWADHPDAVLGQFAFGSGTTTGRPGLIVERPADYAEKLAGIADRIPQDTYRPIERGNEPRFITNNTADRNKSVTIGPDGNLYQVEDQRLVRLEDIAKGSKLSPKLIDQVKRAVGMRRAYGALIDAERDGNPKTEELRTALRDQFEAYRTAHGRIVSSPPLNLMRRLGDPSWEQVAALERPDGTPSRILFEPTIRATRQIDNPSVSDAYVMARNANLNLDMDKVAELAKLPRDQVEAELLRSGAVMRTPGGGFEPTESYLSGNVRRKLREAQTALANNEDMQASVAALESVIPRTVPYYNIEAKLGALWVDNDTYKQFVGRLLGLAPDQLQDAHIGFSGGRWRVVLDRGLNNRAEAVGGQFGTRVYRFQKLLEAALSNRSIKIETTDLDGNKVFDEAASEEANQKAAAIRDEFNDWVWRDPERKIKLEGLYNETMNAIAKARYDGSFMDMSGMALRKGDEPFDLRQHQQNAIWRGVLLGRGLFAHEVGTGKTMTMGGIAVEGRRYGVFRKPLILAHNANSSAVANEIRAMYPGARIHYVDNENLSPANIVPELHRIANEDWDAIVMPHSMIDRMTLKRETLMELAAERIAQLEQEAMEAAREDNARLTPEMMNDKEAMKKLRSVTAKALVRAREAIKANIEKQSNRSSKEGAISFEDLGVDALLVDEAQGFKKPPLSTRMNLKGLNTGTSDRSVALNFLTDYIGRKNNGRGTYLFTGTPITNTLNEIYNMSRYFMRDVLDRLGIGDWDTWFNTFADAVPDVELADDATYQPVTRLSAFVNTDELVRVMSEFTDVVRASDMPEFVKRPTAEGRTPNPIGRPYKQVITDVGEMTPRQRAILAGLQARYANFRSASRAERYKMVRSGELLKIGNGVTNASLDPRLYDPEAEDHPDSKINRLARNVLKEYQTPGAGQAIFIDRGYGRVKTGEGEEGRLVLVNDLIDKLVDGGIPRNEIVVVRGGMDPERKAAISQEMNEGTKRVVIGLSTTLGVGVNMQRQLRAMHHFDAPWRPGDLEQRNGRGERQGNEWNTVKEYRYVTEGIDGRRWQVLATKDRFIRQFIDTFNDTSGKRIGTIEGDAADISDEPDILKTLAEAAGDPRIMVREKLRSDVRRLEKRERSHTQGVAEAASTARSLRSVMAREQDQQADREAQVAAWETAQARADEAARVSGETKRLYEVQFPGDEQPQYLTSADINDRLDKAYLAIARGEPDVPLMTINGHAVKGNWPGSQDAAYLSMYDHRGHLLANPSPSMAGILGAINARKSVAAKGREPSNIAKRIAALEDSAKQSFPQQQALDRKREQLAKLEADLQANPTPAPGWLRHGAPIGSEIYVNGKPQVVEGHRVTPDGYTIVTDEGEVPYREAMDENGQAKFPPPVAGSDRFSNLDVEEDPYALKPGTRVRAFTSLDNRTDHVKGTIVAGPKEDRHGNPTYDVRTDDDGKTISMVRAAFQTEDDALEDERRRGVGPRGADLDVEPEAGHPALSEEDDANRGDDSAGSTTLYSFPGMLFDPQTWRRAFDGIKDVDQYLRGVLRLGQSSRDSMGLARKAVDEIHTLFSPTSRGSEAKGVEHIVRARASMLERASSQSAFALEKFAKALDRLRPDEQLDITDRVERGQPQLLPELQQAMTALKVEQDKWLRMIQSIGRLQDIQNSDDYMGRIYSNYREWKANQQAPNAQTGINRAMGAAMSKSPIRGRAGFLKQRTFYTLADAMQAGLIPVTTNPIRMQLLKLREMQRFYYGTRMADDLKASGIARWVPGASRGRAEAEGLVELKDPYFQPKLRGQALNLPLPNNMRIDPGGWYAPEPAARIFNNYVSRGIAGHNVIYDALRHSGNALNSAQLSLSGFHATFVTLDSIMSKMALGLQQIMRAGTGYDLGSQSRLGSLGQGLKTVASSVAGAPIVPIRTAITGGKLRQAWLDPANATPEMRRLADMLNAGGGRVGMDAFYRSSDKGSFFKTLDDLKRPDGALREMWQMIKDSPVLAPVRIAFRMVDTLNEPLMGALVPRMKLGVFADMARDYLDRNPNATPEEASAAMTKAWDSVDNRMGQLVYDNVFYHKVAKDMAFLLTRSVGWNLGTIREIGGGLGPDSAKFMHDLATGKRPDFTARMAYPVAMTLVTAMIGATLTYLWTGEAPKELMDYFYPKDAQGNRFSIPGYIKDVVAYYHDILGTLANKTHPLLSMLNELRTNRDYYGASIYDPERDPSRRVAYEEYLLNQAIPFSWRAAIKNRENEEPMDVQAMSFWGIQPAPQSITNPEKEQGWQARQDKAAYKKRLKEQGHVSLSPSE